MNEPVLDTNIFEQKRTTEKLVEDSTADLDFYVFLCASVFITTLGLLINNPIVVVGAMLVAPILYPILALGLGIVTSSADAIGRAVGIIGKSLAVGVLVALITAFLINTNQRGMTDQLHLITEPDLFIFFLISSAAGVVASFSWVKQNTAMSLPGVAITVSLVPPLSAIGISVALLSQQLLIGSVMLFLINLLGVVFASVVIFSLFGFHSARVWQDDKIQKQEEEENENEQAEETGSNPNGAGSIS